MYCVSRLWYASTAVSADGCECGERGRGALRRVAARRRRELDEQLAQRRFARPPGQAVVADVGDPAGLEERPNHAPHGGARVGIDPAVDAVEDDEIARRPTAREQLIEVGLVKRDVRDAERRRMAPGAFDVRRDDVAAVELALWKRAGVDDGGGAEAAAELEIHERPVKRPRRRAVHRRRVVQPCRGQLAKELIGIARVGHVAVRGHLR